MVTKGDTPSGRFSSFLRGILPRLPDCLAGIPARTLNYCAQAHWFNDEGRILVKGVDSGATRSGVEISAGDGGGEITLFNQKATVIPNTINKTVEIDGRNGARGGLVRIRDGLHEDPSIELVGHEQDGSFQGATVRVEGRIFTETLEITGGADLAEPFAIASGSSSLEAGFVVVIDEYNAGHVRVSDKAYDRRVAGVISGAGGVKPGLTLAQEGALDEGVKVALTGRVYVWGDASSQAIMPGDLLTTSNTPGHAMKARNHASAQGAILGKAMTPLSQGRGLVLVVSFR